MTAIVLLDAATATGPGVIKKFHTLVKDHTISVTTTGSPTAVTIDLEGSIDDETYFQLAAHVFTVSEITSTNAMFHVVDKPVIFVRINLTTLSGGTAPTVTAKYEGDSTEKSKISRRGVF